MKFEDIQKGNVFEHNKIKYIKHDDTGAFLVDKPKQIEPGYGYKLPVKMIYYKFNYDMEVIPLSS